MSIHAVTLPAAAQGTVAPALSPVLARLRALIADRLLRTVFAPLILPLWTYLKRVELRFARLAIRHAAGAFDAPRPVRASPASGRAPRKSPAAAPLPFPRQPAWFLAALKHEAAYIRTRLTAFLADPETKALIAACPRAAGTLRYVFLMLGMPDPRPRKPRPRPSTPPPALPPTLPPASRPASPPAPTPPPGLRLADPPPRMVAELCPRAAALWPFHPDRLRAKRG